jgi:cysteine desulfurase / selenocysteine lyase
MPNVQRAVEAKAAVAGARDLFPGVAPGPYMNVSVQGLLPTPTREAIDRHLDRHVDGTWGKTDMFATVERTRTRFAHLINAQPDEIAITKNVSEGLNIIASALPWQTGDNLVYCPDLEHPNNVYPWLNLERRLGVELRGVPACDGHIPVNHVIDRMDGRTRLVTLPTVTFSPGFLTDVRPVAAACRAHDATLIVDAAQSIGVIDTDVQQLGIDALAVATQKALLACYGFGFLYCRRTLADQLQPTYLARYGVALGTDAHETASDSEGTLLLAPGARRFDLGNYNYLGATAAEASLALLQDIGVPNIERHVRHLARRLAEGLAELGLPVPGLPDGPHLAHIVAVGNVGAGGHDSANDPQLQHLYQFLTTRDVRLSVRRGVLRFSLHLYNSTDDVDDVIRIVKEWRNTRRTASA